MKLTECIEHIFEKYDHKKDKPAVAKREMISLLKSLEKPLMGSISREKRGSHLKFGKCGNACKLPLAPWVSIMDTRVTKKATSGYYIVLLFKPQLDGFYMGLINAVGATVKKGAPTGGNLRGLKSDVKAHRKALKEILPEHFISSDVELGSRNRTTKAYQSAFICHREYKRNKMPSDKELAKDLNNLIGVYSSYRDVVGLLNKHEKRITISTPKSESNVDLHQTKPTTLSIEDIINKIESGAWRNPKFQRGYEWGDKPSNGIENAMLLIDSVWRGYPIGSILLWEPEDRQEATKVMRYSEDPVFKKIEAGWDPRNDDKFSFILDGQQRSVTFTLLKLGHWPNLCVDLLNERIVVLEGEGDNPSGIYSVMDLLNVCQGRLDLDELHPAPDAKMMTKIMKFNSAVFKNYQVPAVTFEKGDLKNAVTSFIRCNTGGELLATFDIFAASHYNEDFYYRKKVEELISAISKKSWGTVDESDILKITTISLINPEKKGAVRDGMKNQVILDSERLDTDLLINEWNNVSDAISHAIDYLRAKCGVWHLTLLPYSQILYVFSYYYYSNHKHTGSWIAERRHIDWLTRWFWRAVALGRYSESGTTKQLQNDLLAIDQLIKNGDSKIPEILSSNAIWDGKNNKVLIDHLLDTKITSRGSQLRRGVLCALALQDPREWKRGERLDFSNSKIAKCILSSINKHHIFPRKALREIAQNDAKSGDFITPRIDSISNIAYLTFEENVRDPIKDNHPKKYIADLKSENSDLDDAFERSLLPSPDRVMNMQYEEFLKERAHILGSHICELAGLCFSEFIDSNLVLSIRNFEGRIRRFLTSSNHTISLADAMECIPTERRNTLTKRAEKNKKDDQSELEALANELDMGMMFNILSHKKHFRSFFPGVDRKLFIEHKDNVFKANGIRHARDMDPKDVPKVKAAVEYMNRTMREALADA